MIRLLSYNIHGGYGRWGRRNLERVRGILDRHAIDVAVFQEMDTRRARGGDGGIDIDTLCGPDRPHRLEGRTMADGPDEWYGNLIASRYPIERGLAHDLETRPVLEPRNAVDALIRTPIGPLRIVGTHLSLLSSERLAEMTNLIRLMQAIEDESPTPLILCGDINEWQWRSRLLDTLDINMKPVPCGRTFPAIRPLFKLDRVWCEHMPGDAFDIRARVLRTGDLAGISDHLPVLVTIEKRGA